ncbi:MULTISPECIES: RsiV family protein [Glaesserella]|uniref:DUF3298 domain-containing protein n=1 Tax=Glaesserella australis TaxID=2094024 RepID=A0A328C0S8_9PAST|nr:MULTISPECIES: RsiV family protein [Glaesserella]AUI65094.1 hypothetical protein CJD39_00230 [Glaesserella sp. 15-184]RAL18084.1 hypothetical protein C5N92_09375 [Glaesserella australis]
MKKSLIALLVSSVFLLSACDDKEKNALMAQVQQSTQEVTQLKSDVEKAKTELADANKSIAELTVQVEKAKSVFPALKVEIETIFDKKEIVKHKKDPNEENDFFREETPVQLGVTMPKTNVEWINELIYAEFIQNWGRSFDAQGNKVPPAKADKGKEKEMALTILQKQLNEMIASAKEDSAIALTEVLESNYLWQRNNLVLFSQVHQSYTGGAHGMHWVRYLNIDVDKRIILTISDLFSEKNQNAIQEKLWNRYVEQWYEMTGEKETFTAKADFELSGEFYFSEEGLTFAYPPYSLGPYAMGDIYLTLYWDEINPYLAKEYQQTSSRINAEF